MLGLASKFIVLAMFVFFALPVVLVESSDATLEITEWQVPWNNTRPRDPWYGPDGKVWFVGQVGHYVATLDPESGEFKRFDLEEGAGPHTVIVDGEGAWYAGNRVQHIGLIDLHMKAREIYWLPGEGERDPHTMAFTKAGDIWFTVQHGNQVGFMHRETREINLYDMKTSRSRPYGLVLDARDRPWIVLFGTNALATIDPETRQVEEIRLPRSEARPRRLAVTADGMIWYVDYARGYLGRYDPQAWAIAEWRAPAAQDSGPYAMGADGEGRLWFVETGVFPNRFVGFDPQTQTFTPPITIGSGGRVVRHMMFHSGTNSFWFGTDTDTIGRAQVK
ncbi:virginiamycin B lyase family protein [Geoalkalibacter halelectricus]|uniref:Vgb family protein n=1 Tax=Geoalkalibacter halelectricus TaxID=2847045 RepID=UPI003D1DB504